MFSENKVKINFFYYLLSIVTIIFILSYKDLDNYESSKINLIFLILIFSGSVFFEELRSNIFLKILIFYLFFFYILRIIPSIIYNEGQFFINRGINDEDVKKSIFQLNVQYLVLFFSIFILRPNFNISKLPKNNFKNVNLINFILKLILFIMFCNVAFNLFGSIDYNSYQKYLAVIFNIFNSNRLSLVFTVLVFLVIYKKYEIKFFYYKFFIFYGLYIFDTMFLAGSRSSILYLLLTTFFLILLYFNFNKITYKQLFFAIISIPLIQLSFFIPTVIRAINNGALSYSLGLYKDPIAHTYMIKNFFVEWYSIFFRAFSERIGYLDFYIEKLSNKFIYEKVINFSYYSKTILDRITPGIDFFNLPFATKTFQNIYSDAAVNLGRLSEPWEINITNSEQITIFAEMQILFSYYSVIFYFIIFLILNLLIKFLDNFKDVYYQIITIFILITFFNWLENFGFDFFVVQTLYSIFFLTLVISISKIYLAIKK